MIVLVISHFMKIFLLCSQSAPNMALRLIEVQDYPCSFREGGVNLCETLRNVFMYGRFRNSELLCSLPYSGVIVDDKVSDFNRPFLYIAFHSVCVPRLSGTHSPLLSLLLHCMQGKTTVLLGIITEIKLISIFS